MLSLGANAQTLTNGWPNPGAITAAGQSNIWSLSATAGERLSLQISKTSGGAGFSPAFEVFAPDGSSLGVRSGGVAARLDLQASLTGAHTVVVRDANQTGTGTYQLSLMQIPGNFTIPPGDNGGALTNGANQQGVIDVGDLDAWTFSAARGDRIIVQVGEVLGGAGFTPMIELFGPDGTQMESASGALGARVEVQAEASGVFTVLVSDAGQTGTGTYELHLAHVPGSFVVANGDEGGSLPTGADTDGVIGIGDLDLWTFNANPGEKVSLQISKLTGGANFTPLIELLGPGGERKGLSQNASLASIDTAIETSGTYTLVVSDATASGAGTYRLNLTRGIIGSAGANILTNGVMQLGAITASGETNAWTFTASTGDSIVVRVGEITQAGNFSPRLRLLGPTGVQLDTASGAVATEVSVTATNSGTFMVVVDSASTGTGTYRLSLAKTGSALTISSNDEGGPATNGVRHIGSIDVGDMDVWSFTANTGDYITVRMGEMTASLSPQLRLYGPSGALLTFGSGAVAAEVTVRATNSGTFLVVASDLTSGFAGSGDYSLTLAKTGAPVITSPNDEGGALTNGLTYIASVEVGDLDPWTFIANAGENIIVRAGETTASLAPQLRIFGPNGALLDSGSGAVATEVTVRATNSGRFMVVASDLNSGYAGSGNYRLTLSKTGSPVLISPNDEGGELVNGMTYLGSVDVGDNDTWTVTARTGDAMVIRMGEVSGAMSPQLRLYGPNGVLLSSSSGAVAAEVTTQATNSGTFQVVVGDLTSGFAGSGNYRITLAKTGSPLTISGGDEGGGMTGVEFYDGMIDVGDLDAWTFTARAKDVISISVTELVSGSALSPQLRLYGRDGTLLRSFTGAATAQFSNFPAPTNGTYLVVVSDFTSGYAGSGTYRMTVNGLSDGLKFYAPVVTPGAVRLLAVGGVPGSGYTVLTSTNVSIPLNLWAPLSYQFDQFGVADILTTFGSVEPERYFKLRLP